MAAAEDETQPEGRGSSFGSLFDVCLKAFLGSHSTLCCDADDSSSSSSRAFRLPHDLLLQLQKDTGLSLSDAQHPSSSSSSSSSSSREVQEGWSSDLYGCFLLLHRVYIQLRLISPNEPVDEISTPLLRFLLLPHCLGIMTIERPGQIQDRPYRLREAQVYFLEYLQSLESAELLGKEEVARLEAALDAVADPNKAPAFPPGIVDPGARRTKLIEAARAEKQLSDSVKAMLSQKSTGGSWSSGEERRLSLALLQLCAKETFKQLDFIRQETPLLMMRISSDREAASRGPAAEREQKTEPATKPWMATFRNRDDVRNFLRSRVFQPSHNLPTMSLAECADIEMEMETKQIGVSKPKVVVEYPTGEARHAAKETQEMEARRWDDWKDENPKGSGNKMYNRG